jgi:hypothetical protein
MATNRAPMKVIKGVTVVYVVQVADGAGNPLVGQFTGSEALYASCWPGDDEAQSFPLTATWSSGAAGAVLGKVDLAIPGTATAGKETGTYQWLIRLDDSSAALARGELKLGGSPGTGMPGPPELATLPYVQLALSSLSLTSDQVEYLPYAIASASQMIRQYCNRYFSRRTVTKTYYPSLEGTIRLDDFPVNRVLRASTGLADVATITASNSLFQIANVRYSSTGEWDYGFAYTGIELYSVSDGVALTTPLLFATYPTIGALVTAINAVTGWTCSLTGTDYSRKPTSELFCEDDSQGVLESGASLRIFSRDIRVRVDHNTGFVNIGRSASSAPLGLKWGPDAPAWEQAGVVAGENSMVRIQADTGFELIPQDLQMAVAEITRSVIQRLSTDMAIKKESIGEYSYEINSILDSITPGSRQTLSLYRSHTA